MPECIPIFRCSEGTTHLDAYNPSLFIHTGVAPTTSIHKIQSPDINRSENSIVTSLPLVYGTPNLLQYAIQLDRRWWTRGSTSTSLWAAYWSSLSHASSSAKANGTALGRHLATLDAESIP